MLCKIAHMIYRLTTSGLSKGPSISRYYMYKHISNYKRDWNSSARALSISDSQRACRILGFADNQIVNTEYPSVDMLSLPFPSAEFDAVVSEQVLEHLGGNPSDAVQEAYRVLKPGGISLHTTCFLTEIHGWAHDVANDFWRFSPEGLKILSRDCPDILDCGGWGNALALIHIMLGMRYFEIPNARWHPLHWISEWNNPDWPISTWVLSIKRAC